jgi:hypothetical protein
MTENISTKTKVWLALRFIALPMVLLLPFLLIKFSDANCFSSELFNGGHGSINIAVGMKASTGPVIFEALSWLVIVVFLVLSFIQVGVKKYRLRFQYAKQQFLIALASAIVTTPLYIFMYTKSQLTYPPNWYCDSQLQLHGGLSSHAQFGLGLTPVVAAIFVAIYLIAPLVALTIVGPKSRRFWTV